MTSSSRRPVFLTFLAVILFGHAFILPILTIVVLGSNPGTTITVGGEPALLGDHRGEMLLTMLVWWLIAFATAKGIWNRNPWARHGVASVLLVGQVAVALSGLYQRDTATIVGSAAFALLVWWYFYRKDSVRQYFDAWQRAAADKLLDAAVGDELERTLQTDVEESGERR
ncbi:MAG: hypothetical protein QNI99_10725 [Woeseiaceae bacterium]|nr:hypothetical protein [Woeseiaceae bacterium]